MKRFQKIVENLKAIHDQSVFIYTLFIVIDIEHTLNVLILITAIERRIVYGPLL